MSILGSMFGGMGLAGSALQADVWNRQISDMYQQQTSVMRTQIGQAGGVFHIPATQRTVILRRDCRNCGAPWLPVCDHCGSVA